MKMEHIPVLLNEIIENLEINSVGVYVDATLGGAGHSYHILKKLKNAGYLYGFDQDETALETSKKRLNSLSQNHTLIHSNFLFVKEELEKRGIKSVDGIIFDLGVSSFQLDVPERGFSYQYDAPLDMRMNQKNGLTAEQIVNTYDLNSLTRIIREYGEEKFAFQIAKKILEARSTNQIKTTKDLAEIIKKAMPRSALNEKGHPAKRTFQALRIEVNQELEILKESLEKALKLLKPKARLLVISFHSLEDRIVKELFNEYAKDKPTNRFMPPVLNAKLNYRLITKKPMIPTGEEIEKNYRSHSAKLRIIERNEED
jgi:16S rRNA (cytosine1402-N4)-methyltransferase